jgi:hypothetical protein
MIIGFPFGGIIVGVLPSVAYLKYDERLRNTPSFMSSCSMLHFSHSNSLWA